MEIGYLEHTEIIGVLSRIVKRNRNISHRSRDEIRLLITVDRVVASLRIDLKDADLGIAQLPHVEHTGTGILTHLRETDDLVEVKTAGPDDIGLSALKLRKERDDLGKLNSLELIRLGYLLLHGTPGDVHVEHSTDDKEEEEYKHDGDGLTHLYLGAPMNDKCRYALTCDICSLSCSYLLFHIHILSKSKDKTATEASCWWSQDERLRHLSYHIEEDTPRWLLKYPEDPGS